jgi:hypothetical protein
VLPAPELETVRERFEQHEERHALLKAASPPSPRR